MILCEKLRRKSIAEAKTSVKNFFEGEKPSSCQKHKMRKIEKNVESRRKMLCKLLHATAVLFATKSACVKVCG